MPVTHPVDTPTPVGDSDVDAFEAACQELEDVVQRLEAGGLGLDACLRLYERGLELAARCEAVVQQAELRVTRLAAQDDGPSVDEAAF